MFYAFDSTKSCGDRRHCIKTQTFANVCRHQCCPDIYKSGEKLFKVVIKNFRDTSLYECQSLIFSHSSCIRHPLCDTSFGHIRSLFTLSLGQWCYKEKKDKKEPTENLTRCLTARVIMIPFGYQLPFLCTEISTDYSSLGMATMEVNCNLKMLINFFKFFLSTYFREIDELPH